MLGQMGLFPPNAPNGKLKNRVQLEPVHISKVRIILENYHYLGRDRTGRQINYAVLIDGVVDGVITYAYPMMSADLNGVPSDELLEFARLYLHKNIPHSASCAIGKSLRRIKQDWSRKFPDAKPVRLIVSWSDTTRHNGTIYKAANFEWHHRGNGGGNSRGGLRPNGTRRNPIPLPDYKHDKDCWIYWLRE